MSFSIYILPILFNLKFIYSTSDDRAAVFVLASIGEAACCLGAVRIGRSRSGGDAFCTAHEIHAVKHDNPSAMRAAQFNIRSAARNFPLIRSAGMVLSHLNFVAEIEFRQHLHVLRSFGRCTAYADCPQESPQAPGKHSPHGGVGSAVRFIISHLCKKWNTNRGKDLTLVKKNSGTGGIRTCSSAFG